MTSTGRWKVRTAWLCATVSIMVMAHAMPLVAQDSGAAAPAGQARTWRFAIPAKPLPQAIAEFSAVTGVQVLYTEPSVASHTAPAVQGELSTDQALQQLLAGTGLIWRYTAADSVTLERVDAGGDDATMLAPIMVEGLNTRLGTTEGTGSFTTTSTSTATGLNLSPRETPQSVSVMTRQRLDDQNLNEVLDVLQQTPGLTFNQSGALGTDGNSVYARGFEVSNYQVDGTPRSTLYGASDALADTAIYDRVEVVRGATGLLNGVGDPSATINLVRKRPTSQWQGYVLGQLGSWNTYRAEADVSGPLVENGRIRGRLVAAYQDGDSYVDRVEMNKEVFYGTVEADVTENTLVRVAVDYMNRRTDSGSRSGAPLFFADGGLTNFSRGVNSGAEWAYFSSRNLTAYGSIEHRFENDWLASFEYEHSARKYNDLIGYGTAGTLERDGTGMAIWPGRWQAEPEQDTYALKASGPYQLFGREHELMLGVLSYRTKTTGPTYNLWYIDGYDPTIDNYFTWNGQIAEPPFPETGTFEENERQSAVYAATRLRPTDDLSVILGGRVTDWRRKDVNSPFDGDESTTRRKESGVFTPYAGIVYDLTENFSLYASYTSIFRPQSNKDESGTYLDPLEGNAYEGGVKASFYDGLLNGSLAYFQIDQDNLAVAIPGGLTPDGGQAYRSASGTKSRGVEAELAGELMPGWQIGAGYAVAVPEDADGARLLTYIPKSTIKAFTTYQLPGPLENLTIGANWRWQSRTSADGIGPNGEDFTQDPFSVVDVMARYRINDHFSAQLNLNNIFDQKYYTDISFNGYYGEPFNAMLTLKAEW